MAHQTGKNIEVNYKVQPTFGTPVSGAGGKRFRVNASGGLDLTRATVMPNEIRADMKTSMARMGSKSVAGSYSGDLSLGTFDELFEAVFRGTWVAAVAITEATMTSVTTGANTIVAAAGSWITQGVRVGDVIFATGLPDAANNNRNLRVTAVSTLTITVAETLTVNAAPDSLFQITIRKKITQPATVVRRLFTFEQYYTDLDLAAQIPDARISSMKITGAPDGMALVEFGIVATDVIPLVVGTSPNFTTPTLTTSIGLVINDASIRFGGSDVVNLSNFEVTLDNRQSGMAVIGSLTSPDIFDNNAVVNGTISGTRQDLNALTRLRGETELELHVMLVEPEAELKDCISIFLPRLKLTGATAPLGGDGAMIETMPFTAGNKEVVTGYDDTMIKINTSAA